MVTLLIKFTFIFATFIQAITFVISASDSDHSRCHPSSIRRISVLEGSGSDSAEGYLLRSPLSLRTGHYRRNEDCRWLLNSDTPLSLTFMQLDVEPSRDCRYDAVQIFDNYAYQHHNNHKSGSGNRLINLPQQPNVTLCGNSTPPAPIITPPGYTLIRFRTDATNEGKGFMLRYKKEKMAKKEQNVDSRRSATSKPKQTTPHQQRAGGASKPVAAAGVKTAPTAFTAVCNQTITVSNNGGIIHSYRDPATGNYLPNQDCFILLKSPQPLRLTFKSMLHLQDPGVDGICRSDGLVIYNASFSLNDRPKNTSHIFCGFTDCNSACNSLYTDGDVMLRFVTDSQAEFKGFTLHYEFAGGHGGNSNTKKTTAPTRISDELRQVVWWGGQTDGAGAITSQAATTVSSSSSFVIFINITTLILSLL